MFLCVKTENSQQQSCKAFIGLNTYVKMTGGGPSTFYQQAF